MSATSRRKQKAPKRLSDPSDAENIPNGKEPVPSLDSHVCGYCCAQFFTLEDFVAHKQGCARKWPNGVTRLNASSDLIDYTNNNNNTKNVAQDLRGNVFSSSQNQTSPAEKTEEEEPIMNALMTLDPRVVAQLAKSDEEQQEDCSREIMAQRMRSEQSDEAKGLQLELVRQLVAKLLPDPAPNPDDLLSSILPYGAPREELKQLLHAMEAPRSLECDKCHELFSSLGRLDWHTISEHEEFRCELCNDTFDGQRSLRLHMASHSVANQLRAIRPRSSEPQHAHPILGDCERLKDRRSVPPFVEQDKWEGLVEAAEQSDEGSSPRPNDYATGFSDISRSSTPRLRIKLNGEHPLDLSTNSTPFDWRNSGELEYKSFASSLFPSMARMSSENYPETASLLADFSPKLQRKEVAEEDWESMMEISQTDEAEKIRQLVGDRPQPPTTDPNQCLVCRRILSCKSALQMHYRTHTGERPFKCKICLRAFTTKGNLKTHMGVHSSRSKHPFRLHHQCPICQKRFTNAILLQQHVRLHTSQLSHPPPPPPPPPVSSNGFSMEQQRLFPPQPPPPPRTYTSAPTLQLSSPLDQMAKMRFDPPADPTPHHQHFPRLPTMSSHPPFPMPHFPSFSPGPAAVKSGRQNTTCNICYKSFACYSALEIHYRSHTKERPFKCSQCGRGFSTRGNMKQHLLTHKIRDTPGSGSDSNSSAAALLNGGGPGPERTPLRTASEASFDEHMEAMREDSLSRSSAPEKPDDKPIAPEVNGNGVGPSPLESIEKMWAKTEPPMQRKTPILSRHQCGVCFKHFSSSSALQIHMRTHTGDKPFKCTYCGRAFTTKGNLKVHMGTHMWNNPSETMSHFSRRGRRIFDFPTPFMSAPTMAPPQKSEAEEMKQEPAESSSFSMPGLALSSQPTSSMAAELSPPGFYSSAPHWQPFPPPYLHPPPPPPTNPFMPPMNTPQNGPSMNNAQNGPPGGNPMEAMMWLWRNVCSVCQKVCASPLELEEHLKLHLQRAPGEVAPEGSAAVV